MHCYIMSRLSKLFINSLFGLLAFTVHIVASLILQRFLNAQLGLEIVGLNALLISSIGALAVVDIGLTTAIEFALYKPLAEKDHEKVALLVRYFRKVYLTIGGIIVAVALVIFPILPSLTGGYFSFLFVLPPFLLFLTHSFSTYFFSYNHKLLFADQKQFISSISAVLTRILTSGIQIVLLLTLPFGEQFTYYLFLMVMLGVSIGFNIGITIFVKKRYPYLNKYKGKLSKEFMAPTQQNVLAFGLHRIGDVVFVAKDTFLVSAILGVFWAGVFANYTLLVTNLNLLSVAIFSGVVATFGNMLANEPRESVYQKFKKVKFLNFFFFTLAATVLFVLANDFLYEIILPPDAGAEYVFRQHTIVFLAINMFLFGYSAILRHIRVAAGAYNPDKWFQILFVFIGVGLSVGLGFALRPFGELHGITGVLIGTTVTWVLRDIVVLPIIAKKHIHNGKRREYYVRFFIDLGIAAACVAICAVIYFFAIQPYIANRAARLVTGFIICLVIPSAIMLAVYHRTEEFAYLKKTLKRLWLQLRKKKEPEVAEEPVIEDVEILEHIEREQQQVEEVLEQEEEQQQTERI